MRILKFNRFRIIKKKIYLREDVSDDNWNDEEYLYDASIKPGYRPSRKEVRRSKKGSPKQSESMIEQDILKQIEVKTKKNEEAIREEDPPVVGNGGSVMAALGKTVFLESEKNIVVSDPIPLAAPEEKNTEKELRDEKIKYFATELVSDMKTFYGGPGDKTMSTKRLDAAGVHQVSKLDGRKDYEYGQSLTEVLSEFFKMKEEFPPRWTFLEANLVPLGLTKEDLLEAREEKFKGLDSQEEQKQPEVKTVELENEQMSIEGKISRVASSGSGGYWVDQLRAIVVGKEAKEDIDTVSKQLSDVFGFDVKAFAGEWKRKRVEEGNEIPKNKENSDF